MAELKKILVPVDFSEHSRFAAQKALSLADVCDAALYFLHVGESAHETAEALSRFVLELASKNPGRVKKFVAQGNPATVILSTARKLMPDVILMGHRDLSGLKQLMQGSVAEKVLRESICPVLIMKKKRPREFGEYVLPQLRKIEEAFQADRILVPLDFSAASKRAFQYAVDLAILYNSTIYTVTVFDKKFKELAEDRKKHTALMVHGRKVQLWKEFPDLLKTVPENPKSRIKRLLLEGDPSTKIESVVKKKEIDLVIMGTNGRTGLEHLLIGSVAEKALRSFDCPVMTIRAKRDALYLR
jgi:nucleotide-binding universal stress UspA family protein